MSDRGDRPDLAGLERWGFDVPGPLRDRLNAAVLIGGKTATSSLYDGSEDLGSVGALELLLDSDERPIAVIEITRMEVRRLADVDLEVALAEGEGYASVAAWRASHERYFIAELAGTGQVVVEDSLDDDVRVVIEWFRVVERLRVSPRRNA